MFNPSLRVALTVFLFCLTIGVTVGADVGSGRLEGRVMARGGVPHPGVVVVIQELKQEQLTDRQGRYAFNALPVGSYTVLFIFGGENVARPGVLVRDGELSTIDIETEWDPSFVEKLTVYGASRRAERIVEAPAAVTVIGEEEIAREAAHGPMWPTRWMKCTMNRSVAT